MRKLLIVLPFLFLIGCVATNEVYLPHTSRVFHKKNCVACNDPSPIIFPSAQSAINFGIKPCINCIKTNQYSVPSSSIQYPPSYPSSAVNNQNSSGGFWSGLGTFLGSFAGAAVSSASSYPSYDSIPSYSGTNTLTNSNYTNSLGTPSLYDANTSSQSLFDTGKPYEKLRGRGYNPYQPRGYDYYESDIKTNRTP